jgi:hypothetical protein
MNEKWNEGYPSPQLTAPLLLAMEAGGVDVIELGIPYSEPFVDGPVIQECHQVSHIFILRTNGNSSFINAPSFHWKFHIRWLCGTR